MKNRIGAVLRYFVTVLRNVLAGTRALFFLPVKSTAFRFSGDDIVGQILLGLGTIFALGYVTLLRHPSPEFNRSFNADGITLALSAYLVIALGCYLSVRLPGRQHATRPVLLMVFSMVPAVLVAVYALTEVTAGNFIDRYWAIIGFAVFCWFAIAAARVLHLACGTRSLALLVSSSLLAGLAVAPFMILGPQPLWYVWKKDRPTTYVNTENTYHRQHALLSQAMNDVAAGRPGVPEFYFVGFAGWASEDVFMNETRAAADLFQRRFGAKGRTLILLNNPDTIADVPLASVSNLRDAINGVARKMDGDEDILFLYVTSHGSPRSVGVRHGRLRLNTLRAKSLRKILDEAGIKNRVLAISACYSGSFIEPLGNENTLIMTASAADRTSFGCGHDGTFTYFGSALIGDALEKEFSFPRAFEAAAKSIEKREKKEGLKASKPQIYVGKAIGPVLERIERHLKKER
jgi:hypothetical protein